MAIFEPRERVLTDLLGDRDGGAVGAGVGGGVAVFTEYVRLGPFPLAPPRMLYAAHNRKRRRADLARKRAR